MAETVQDIIDYVDRKYPNQETDANKIIDLNVVYKELYNVIERLTDNYEITEINTVANQATYTLPTRCKIYNVIKMTLSQDTTSNIDSDTVWEELEYASLGTDIRSGFYYGRVSDTIFAVFKDGKAVTTGDLVIKIFHYLIQEDLTSVTDELELDERYTMLLKYALINQIASQGANPDTDIADYYQRKYDEGLKVVMDDMSQRLDETPIEYTEPVDIW